MNNRNYIPEIIMTEYRRIYKEAEGITAVFGKFSQPTSDINYPQFYTEFKEHSGSFIIFLHQIQDYANLFNFIEFRSQISGFRSVIDACTNNANANERYANPLTLRTSFNNTLTHLSAITMQKIREIEKQYNQQFEVNSEKKPDGARFRI